MCNVHVLQGYLESEIVVNTTLSLPTYLTYSETIGCAMPHFGTDASFYTTGFLKLSVDDLSAPADLLYTFDQDVEFKQG